MHMTTLAAVQILPVHLFDLSVAVNTLKSESWVRLTALTRLILAENLRCIHLRVTLLVALNRGKIRLPFGPRLLFHLLVEHLDSGKSPILPCLALEVKITANWVALRPGLVLKMALLVGLQMWIGNWGPVLGAQPIWVLISLSWRHLGWPYFFWPSMLLHLGGDIQAKSTLEILHFLLFCLLKVYLFPFIRQLIIHDWFKFYFK